MKPYSKTIQKNLQLRAKIQELEAKCINLEGKMQRTKIEPISQSQSGGNGSANIPSGYTNVPQQPT